MNDHALVFNGAAHFLEGKPAQRNIFLLPFFEVMVLCLMILFWDTSRYCNSTSNHRLWLINHGFPSIEPYETLISRGERVRRGGVGGLAISRQFDWPLISLDIFVGLGSGL